MVAVHGVDVDHLGRIVVVGTVLPTINNAQFVVARLTSLGQQDATFDSIEQDGIVTFQAAGKNANVARSVDAFLDQSNQPRILVSGWVGDNMMGPKDFAVFQMEENGRLDQAFGASGIRIVDASGSSAHDQAWSMIRQPNGAIVLAGMVGESVGEGGPSDFALVRYLPNAQGGFDGRDPSFGFRGIVKHHVRQVDEGRSVALQSDGTLVVAGFISNAGAAPNGEAFHVMRFSSNGVLEDETSSTFPNAVGHGDQAWAMFVDSQDRIVAGGFHTQQFVFPEPLAPLVIQPAFAAIRLCDVSCAGGAAAGAGSPSGPEGAPISADPTAISWGSAAGATASPTAETPIGDNGAARLLPEYPAPNSDPMPLNISSSPSSAQEELAMASFVALDTLAFLSWLKPVGEEMAGKS
jgi:uncharacterized delta-60 repeat protein